MYMNNQPVAKGVRSPKGSDPDPVTEQRFTLKLELPGVKLGTFREISGIGVEVETMDYTEGGNNEFVYKLPVRVKYQNLVLKRGITHHSALLQWFQDARTQGVQSVKKDMTITLMGPGGETIRTWAFTDAYPVKWTGPTLNASSGQIATETLEIAHTGLKVA